MQLHSLPKGALCFFDVSQLLPQKGAAAHSQRERSIPKCIVAQLSSGKRSSSTARGSICTKLFSMHIYFFNYSLFTDNNIMNKKKLYYITYLNYTYVMTYLCFDISIVSFDLGSKRYYYFPAYLGVVHFQTIYFPQSDLSESEKKFYRLSWLSNYDTHRQNTIYMPFFLNFYFHTHFLFY